MNEMYTKRTFVNYLDIGCGPGAYINALNSLFEPGFVVDGISEGVVGEKLKKKSKAAYEKLSTRPQFIFIRAVKK